MMNDYVCQSCHGSVSVAAPREYKYVEHDGKKFMEMWFEPASPQDLQRLQMLAYDPYSTMAAEAHPSVKYPLVAQWDSVPIPGNPQGLHRRVLRVMLDVSEEKPEQEETTPQKKDDLTYSSKPFLLEEAQKAGIECDETWTRPKLIEALRTKRTAPVAVAV